MTAPRAIFPDRTYLLTRRCAQREILLSPSAETIQIFAFCLGWLAEECDIKIHAICVLGNHYHAVVTDPSAQLPVFMQEFNKYTAKCVNASLGRRENLWVVEQPSVVELKTDDDVLNKMVYTLANPVSSLLVQRGDMWPGLHLGGEAWGHDTVVRRPEVFFRSDGKVPQKVTLRMSRPGIHKDLDDTALAALLRERVEAREAEKRSETRREGKRFLGLARVKREVIGRRPTSRSIRGGLRPKLACRDRWRRIEALQRIKAFYDAYYQAYKAWREGDRDVVFPAGTYALRIREGVACAPAT